MRDVRVQFGDLDDFFGMPGRAENFTFVPATVRLHGDDLSFDHYLGESVQNPPLALALAIRDRFDAAWVRARIPQIFGFTPEPSEGEKSLLHATFLAVETGSLFAYPFHCSDVYGRTGLLFSPLGPDAETQRKIASALWSLLLQHPDDLADFETKVYHSGAGVWMTFGCSDGNLYYSESSEGPE